MIAGAAAMLLLSGPGPATSGEPTAGARTVTCESQTPGGDRLDFRCPLPAATRHFRFRANFSGGHDDTKASMTATLDEQPLTCEEGSKTRLFAEEGDVSLECRFSIAGASTAEHLLRVTLVWSHAEYTDFALAEVIE